MSCFLSWLCCQRIIAHHATVLASVSPSPPLALSSSDFPALVADVSQSPAAEDVAAQAADNKTQRKLAKKAAAAEKAAERLKAAQEKIAAKAAEKARIATERAAEREKAAAEKAQQEKEIAEREKSEKERLAREKEILAEREKEEKEKAALALREKASHAKKGKQPAKASGSLPSPKASSVPVVPEPVTQVPLLSKKPKKNKPASKPIRITKEEDAVAEDPSN